MTDELDAADGCDECQEQPSIFGISPKSLLLAGLIVAATLVAYAPALRAGFIWDDDAFLTKNPLIHAPDGPIRFWFTTQAPDYFPLTSSMLWFEWRLWGMHAAGYHLVNVLLHAASAILLWRVLLRLKVHGAWVGAMLFALHPVAVESVAWITERKNTLPMTLGLLATLLYLRSEDSPSSTSKRYYWQSVIAYAMALLAKTSVVPLPVVLLGMDWWRRGRLRWRDVWRVLPFFALAAGLSAATIIFQHAAIGPEIVRTDGPLGRLVTAGWAVWFYLYKALVPLNLSFVYPRWTVDLRSAVSYLPLAAAVIVAVVLWRGRRGWARPLAFSLGCFAVMLVPVIGFLNIYFMRYSLVADHWQYFSLPAITALVGAAVAWIYVRIPAALRRPALAAGACMLVGLGWLGFSQATIYRDSGTLWADVLKKNPSCWLADDNTGVGLASRGQYNEAAEWFRKSLAIKPDHVEAHYDLAKALSHMPGQRDTMLHELREAVRIQPLHSNALTQLAWVLAADPDSRNRDGKQAVELAERACEITARRQIMPLMSLAAACAEAGQFDRAVQVAGEGEHLAMEQGDEEKASVFSALAQSFRRHQPFRETRAVIP